MKSTLGCLAALIILATPGPVFGAEMAKSAPDLTVGTNRNEIGDGLCLHNLFQSGMVLQRDKPIRIWGWAAPGENVTVTFGEMTQSCIAAADRSWKVELPALPANSEGRTLVVQGKAKTLKLEDCLLGDVWLLGGQSNMEFPIYKVDAGSLEMASANFRNIRLFTVPQLNGPDDKNAFPRRYQWGDFLSEHYTDTNMPFGIISLCTCGDPQDLDNYLEKMSDLGIWIREIQYKTFLDFQKAGDKNVGYASSFDQRRSWYHPQIKIPVGERIAGWALATQYGMKDIRWLPPTIREMKVDAGNMILKLDTSEAGPYNDGPILGFAIAGKDRKFQPAKAV